MKNWQQFCIFSAWRDAERPEAQIVIANLPSPKLWGFSQQGLKTLVLPNNLIFVYEKFEAQEDLLPSKNTAF